MDISKDDGKSHTRAHITEEWEEVPKGPSKNPIKPDDNTRKEPEPVKDITTQRNDTNTATSQLEAQGMQDIGKREVGSPEETRKIDLQVHQQESPETARILMIWSVCLIVASVCSVCLALSIHAPRGEVNTIIDFMMVSSPLDRHKAPHTQINEQQYQTQY